MTTLHDIGVELDDEQYEVVCRAINTFSDGGHPMPDWDSVPFFAVAFVRRMLKLVPVSTASHREKEVARGLLKVIDG